MDRELMRAVRQAQATFEDRRNFLRRSAFAVGGAGLLLGGCTSGSDDEQETVASAGGGQAAAGGGQEQGQTGDGTSLFDRIVDGETVRLGADLTFPPLQYRDENDEPAGYVVEATVRMMEDLGAEYEFVDVPFGELFGALAAGRFDFAGIAATILPSRAQQVMFAAEPLFVESTLFLVNVDSPVRTVEDFNSPDVTISTLVGSAQEASAAALFPEAQLRALEQQPSIQEAATGRADAVLTSEFSAVDVLETTPSLTPLEAPPLFADINTYFMPIGDFRMKAYVDNWLRYNIVRGTLAGRWEELIARPVREFGITSVPVTSPYLPRQETQA